MSLISTNQTRRWVRIFAAIHVLVLLQVAWWTWVFLQDVSTLEQLRLENLAVHPNLTEIEIRSEAFHRRVMFVSESVFFALLTCVGFYLLYRALRSEERSREIQRNFIEIVTHESKTPLTALKLRLESALEKDSASARDLTLALEEVRRLAGVFDKTMSLNRMEREVLNQEVLSLADVVKQVNRRLEPFFRARGVEVTLELDSEALVRGDDHSLQNSVQSLLENAVLYNQASEKRVVVKVARQGQHVVLSVADNGPGIPAADRAQLFERFYRGQTGKGIPGTGLGLYLAKRIVEAHHGVIRVADNVKSGATFLLQFPSASGGAA